MANNPYPYYPYMLVIENYCPKFTIMSFWAPTLKSPAENGIPKKSLDRSLVASLSYYKRKKNIQKFSKNLDLKTSFRPFCVWK